jgi:SAM-dependent methyltransferase
MELLDRYLPPPPALILDIGGGTGPYSEALGRRGYETHLLDPVEKHVERAKRRTGVASAIVGDARKLQWLDEFADAALLLGPLYHLTEKDDRYAALREARRVLKPGGVLAVAGISRFASLLDGLARGFINDPGFRSILIRDLDSGDHRNTTGNIDYFTSVHFHLPAELSDEVTSAGFVDARVYSVEGLGWLASDLRDTLVDAGRREFLLELLRRTEEEQSILGASPHLLVCARVAGEKA